MDKRAEIVRRGYNQLGSTFDQWAEAVRVEEREKYLTKIGESFADGSIILDVGCGNGLLNTKQFRPSHNPLLVEEDILGS